MSVWDALQYAQSCDDCDCSSACKLYERLTFYLNTSPDLPESCGCSAA
jgi:hypothetical protein